MRAGQSVEAGAIDMELLEHRDAAGAGLQQGGLGGDDVVVGEAAPVEAVAHQNDGALGLGKGFLPDPASFAGSGHDLNLQARDLTFTVDAGGGEITLGGQPLRSGAVDGPEVLVVATKGNRRADDKAEVVAVPEVTDAGADRGVRPGAGRLHRHPGDGDVALCDEDVQVRLGDPIRDVERRPGVGEGLGAKGEVR